MSQRKRTLAAVGLSAAGILALAGWTWKSRAERDWAELVERARSIRDEVNALPASRPVLCGGPEDGRSFEHYVRAIELAKGIGGPPGWTLERLTDAAVDRAECADYVQRIAPALCELRRGARARDARLAVDWENTLGWPQLGLSEPRLLMDIALAVFVAELAEGRPTEAVDVLLDGFQFARDLAASPLLIDGASGARLFLRPRLSALGEQGGWSLLPEEELARVIGALAIVDEGIPSIGDGPRVNTVIALLSEDARIADLEAGPFRRNQPLRPFRFLGALARTYQHDGYQMLFEFAHDYEEACTPGAASEPALVRAEYEPFAEREDFLVGIRFEAQGMASEKRLEGLDCLRVLRYALAVLADRNDTPAFTRLGRPIRSKVTNGMRRVFLDRPGPTGFVGISLPVQ